MSQGSSMFVRLRRDGVFEVDADDYASGGVPAVPWPPDTNLFPEVTFDQVFAMTLYDGTDPTVGSWWWDRRSGWRHVPYRQPRPWKAHTPGRFRQRRR